MRNIETKVRMSQAEHDRFTSAADDCGLRYADYARFCIFGPGGSTKLPHQERFARIAYDLSRISDNINRAMFAIHRAEKKSVVSRAEFEEIHAALAEALPAFQEPREKFLSLLVEFKRP